MRLAVSAAAVAIALLALTALALRSSRSAEARLVELKVGAANGGGAGTGAGEGGEDAAAPARSQARRSDESMCGHLCSKCVAMERDSAACLACKHGSFLHDDKCVAKCPAGLMPTGADLGSRDENASRKCLERSSVAGNCNCSECVRASCECDSNSSEGSCRLCKSFKFLLQGKCVDSCPKGYKEKGSSRFGRMCVHRDGMRGVLSGQNNIQGNSNSALVSDENGQVRQRTGAKSVPTESFVGENAHGEEVDAPAGNKETYVASTEKQNNATVHVVPWGDPDYRQGGTVLNIDVGDSVKWVFAGRHSVISGRNGVSDGLFSSGKPGAVADYSVQFDTAGVYHYFCQSHSGSMRAQIVVGDAEIPVKYSLTFQGASDGVKEPKRFSTAMRDVFILFDEAVADLAECERRCSSKAQCRGIYYYKSRRCKGLSNTGDEGVETNVDANSYSKIVL